MNDANTVVHQMNQMYERVQLLVALGNAFQFFVAGLRVLSYCWDGMPAGPAFLASL